MSTGRIFRNWATHNVIAHPLMQLFNCIGLSKLGLVIHDKTLPLDAAALAQEVESVEMSPEFTDTARAAIAWVLWHYQGGSSAVGQPLRFALGMGEHERLSEWQINEAKRWAALTGAKTADFHARMPPQDPEADRLRALINAPEVDAFLRGTHIEAVHQVERWGTAHDRAKRAADWFWLVGYLAGKALHAAVDGDVEKAKHHTISSAAALYNWHCSISGTDVRMCPGRSDLAEMVDGQFPGEAHG